MPSKSSSSYRSQAKPSSNPFRLPNMELKKGKGVSWAAFDPRKLWALISNLLRSQCMKGEAGTRRGCNIGAPENPA
nr:hypothetical protein Iba_scaffold2300CG0800 [Ipomoea batatas]GME09099.1 hypothetical protein Iba_scaffold8164CG0030 [Ipomoea batatas]